MTEFNGKIKYEAVKGPTGWFFQECKKIPLFFLDFFKFHPETMRTLSLGSFAIFCQNYILNIQTPFVINNQNI